MRPPRASALTLAVATTALLAGLSSAVSEASGSSSSSTQWCANTVDVVLTTCGSKCGEDQACAQYPAKSKITCSDAARNKCQAYDTSCTFQCLSVFNSIVGKWTLFVKEPSASDVFDVTKPTEPFPAAPIENIMGFQVPTDAKIIQLTGFDATNVPKGSVKSLKLDNNMFEKSLTLQTLNLGNIDLSKLATNFLPKSVSTLLMDNCQLSDVPPDVANMANIRTLNVSKNLIAELPSADSKTVKTLQSLTTLNLRGNGLTTFNWVLPALTTLDLGENKLTTFPTSVFNMTKLTSLYLDGNNIPSISLTSDQLNFLKRLSVSTSSLGVSAASSCATGERQDTVLGVSVCVADASATIAPAAKSSSGSNIGLIAGIAAGVVVVIVIVGFFCYRRRSKAKANSEFYVSVMENGGNSGQNTGGNTGGGHTGNSTNNSRSSIFNRGRAASGGRRSSIQNTGGRPSRAPSNASKPSISSNPEMGVYQEQLSSVNSSSTMALVAGGTTSGSRQRQRAQINQNVVRIATQDINYTRTMAKGAHGEVWLAHLGRDLVAVKKLISTDPDSVGAFVGELNLLASLSHPRILTLVGGCWADDMSDLQIVLEFMDSGDLLTVLRNKTPAELTWENGKAAYCVQICEAVYYLHSLQPALIHRDIKSRNILVDARKGAKLSDFGESRERTIQNTMTAGVGTARWVAPEIILGEDYSELADIYSLGVLLTELDTHEIPFEGLKLEEHMIVQQVAVGKLRPKVSDSCPEVIRRLAHECLQFDPQLRPTAARVLQTLMASPLARRLSTISDSE